MAYTTIDDPTIYFNTVLWTGNTTNSTAITGVGFQPDMVWIKNRSTTDNHAIFDAIRGATYRIYPNDTDAQIQATNSLASFDSDGFTLNDGGDANGVGEDIVGWNWKANGSGSSNEAGSINTTATSVDTTSGFSISTYTGNDTAGATIGHGLGAVPGLIIIKCLDASQSWVVYHHKNTAAPETDFLILNDNDATADHVNRWNDTAPTSTLITLGDENQSNGSQTYVAYAWTEKQGYSKLGSYTGNGSPSGPMIWLGFRPAMVIAKRTDSTGYWRMRDNKRTPYNVIDKVLRPDTDEAEITEDNHDFLSNGFKVRTSGPENNASGGTYVYAAFSEAPLINSNGVPCNAR